MDFLGEAGPMPMTLEQIVEETRSWPPEQVGELVGRLTEDLHASRPEIEAAWNAEIDRRIAGIQSGQVKGIPPEQVAARIQEIFKR
jgi:putative addiction module component (TIGR02574 family)